MKLRSAAVGLIVGAALALGFTAGATPAAAQEATPQATPWYMPQPWVYPPQTGPKIRKLPGYYGHRRNYNNGAYGGFSNYCYGDCGYRVPGTVSTGGGVILSQPVVAYFDPDAYQIVPRELLYQSETLPALPEPVGRPAPVQPAVISARTPTPRMVDMKPKFSLQNGVRIIRPTPLEAN